MTRFSAGFRVRSMQNLYSPGTPKRGSGRARVRPVRCHSGGRRRRRTGADCGGGRKSGWGMVAGAGPGPRVEGRRSTASGTVRRRAMLGEPRRCRLNAVAAAHPRVAATAFLSGPGPIGCRLPTLCQPQGAHSARRALRALGFSADATLIDQGSITTPAASETTALADRAR